MDSFDDIPFAVAVDRCCGRCGRDLSALGEARFCPRCGWEQFASITLKQDSLVKDEIEPSAPLRPALAASCQWHEPIPVAWPVYPRVDPSRFHSLMIVGYARAMKSLGTRYEAGVGVARNTDEAIRYYCKAARMGSGDALEKLAQRGFISPDSPADPPAPPGARAPQRQ